MAPDDSKRQDDIDREWQEEWARGADIRERKIIEAKVRFEEQILTEEDRFLLDHPAPPKVLPQPVPERLPRLHTRTTPAWDDEQFSGQTFDPTTWTGTATADPKRILVTSSLSESLPFTMKNPRTTTSLWLCQICRRAQADWPREISWQRIVWGLRLSLVLRSPFACTNCRIIRFEEQQALGHRDHRPFWNNVIEFMTGHTQTRTVDGICIHWINRWRGRHGVA